MQFFNPTNDTTESKINQSVIDFMNENAGENDNDSPADNVDPIKRYINHSRTNHLGNQIPKQNT